MKSLLNDVGGEQSLRQKSAQGAVIMLSSQAARFIITLIYQVIITRLLGPANFGLIAMVGPMVAFIYMFNTLGLTQVTVQKSSITHDELSSLFWITAIFGIMVFLIGVAIAPLAGWFYNDRRVVGVMMWFSTTLILSGLSAQHMAILNRKMQFLRIAAIEISSAAGGSAAAVYTALHGWGYWSLVMTSIVTSLITALLAWILSGWCPSLRPNFSGISGMLRFGGNVTGFNIFNFVSQNLQNILIGRMNGTVQLGYYDRAYKLMLFPLVQIQQPISRVAIPVLSRLQDSHERYNRAYMQMVQGIYLAAVPGVICGVTLPSTIIITLFGIKWLPVAPILFWLSIFGIFSFLSGSTGWLFVSQGRTREYLVLGMVNAVIYVIAFVVGVNDGATGVARAYAVSGALLTVPIAVYAATRHGPVALTAVLKMMWPFAVSGVITLIIIAILKQHFQLTGPTGMVAGFGISYATNWGALLCLPSGRHMFLKIISIRSVLFAKSPLAHDKSPAETTTA